MSAVDVADRIAVWIGGPVSFAVCVWTYNFAGHNGAVLLPGFIGLWIVLAMFVYIIGATVDWVVGVFS